MFTHAKLFKFVVNIISIILVFQINGSNISKAQISIVAAPNDHYGWSLRQPPFITVYVNGFPYPDPYVDLVTFGGLNFNTIFSSSKDQDKLSPFPDGLYQSKNKELSWNRMGSYPMPMKGLVVNPKNPNILLAWRDKVYVTEPYVISKSEDGGLTWKGVMADGMVYDVEFDPSDPNIVYTSTCCSGSNADLGEIFKSIDTGKSWTRLADIWLHDLEVDPFNSNVIYGARGFSNNRKEGVYKSIDGGLTWTQLPLITPQPYITVDSLTPGRIYAYGSGYLGIWRSDDYGENWKRLSDNLPVSMTWPTIFSVALDPIKPDTIWIGLKYEGMYVSYDAGENWIEQNDGIFNSVHGQYGPQCYSMTISPDGNNMTIVCNGYIYWRVKYYDTFMPIMR